MILTRYIAKEITSSFLGVFLVLLLILISSQFLRILSAVTEGKYPLELLFSLVGLVITRSLPLVLPLAIFIAVLLALGRLNRDNEVIAMGACGIGPEQQLKTAMILGVVFVLLQSVLALHLRPWALTMEHDLVVASEQVSEATQLNPGQFNKSELGDRVLYVESLSDDEQLNNVFMQIRQQLTKVELKERAQNPDVTYPQPMSQVLAADNAQMQASEEYQAEYLEFAEGHRYDGVPGQLNYRITQFERYGVLIKKSEAAKKAKEEESKTLDELFASSSSRDAAELQWRFSMIIAVFVLPLLAVPLSKVNPRQGRYAKIAGAILIYLIYSNLLGVAQAWVKKDKVPEVIGMWWVQLLVVGLFVVLYGKQQGWFKRKVS